MCNKYLFESSVYSDNGETEGPKIEVPMTEKQICIMKGFMLKYGTDSFLYNLEEYNKHTHDFIMKIINEKMQKMNCYDPNRCVIFRCPQVLKDEVEQERLRKGETNQKLFTIKTNKTMTKPVYSYRINTKSGSVFFDFKSFNNAKSENGNNEYIQITQSRKKKDEETYHYERIFIPRSDFNLLKEAVLQAAEYYDKQSQLSAVSI